MSAFARSRPSRIAVVVLLAFAAACTEEDSSTGTTTAPTTAPVPTTTPTVTAATTTPTATAAATTAATTASTTAATANPSTFPSTVPATSEPCVAPAGTDTFEDGFPLRMSSLVGVDIRTGAHPCFERVVIELGGDGDMPGVRVAYVDDPVVLSPSDMAVDIAGDATLLVAVAAWMPDMEGTGWAGPTQITPTNVTHIVELRQVENFEGMHQWAIGLDERVAFDVSLLDDPPRIVIDVAV